MKDIVLPVFTAMLACSLFILLSIFLRHKTNFVSKYGVNFVLMLLVVGLVRLFLPFEFEFTQIIESDKMMVSLLRFIRTPCFSFAGQTITIGNIILIIWVLGSIIVLTKLLFQIYKTKYFINNIQSLENSIAEEILKKIVKCTIPNQRYKLLITNEISTPMLVGYFRPTILIPQLDLSSDEFYYILLHEWTHFLQRDLWKKLILQIIIALLWWNPLIYIAKKDFDYALEVDCDRRVVNGLTSENRINYVEATVKVMRQILQTKQHNQYVAIHFVETENKPVILQRCELILDPPNKMTKPLFYGLNIALMCGFLMSYLFVIQPHKLNPNDSNLLLPSNTYIILTKDNQYKLYSDGVYLQSFTENTIDADLLASIDIIKERE